MCVLKVFRHTHWLELRKNQYDEYNTFFTIHIDMSMKYKRDIHIKFDVPWLFTSESIVYFLPLFRFLEDHNKKSPLRKVNPSRPVHFRKLYSNKN